MPDTLKWIRARCQPRQAGAIGRNEAMLSLGKAGLPRSAVLRVAITLATALLGAALLPGLTMTPRANVHEGVLAGSLLWTPGDLTQTSSSV